MNDWKCLDCLYKGELNRQGHCGRCDSKAVMPDRIPPKGWFAAFWEAQQARTEQG